MTETTARDPLIHVGATVVFFENADRPNVAGRITRVWERAPYVSIRTLDDNRLFVRHLDRVVIT